MLILSKIMEWMVGKAAIPILVICMLVLGGKMLDARRAALISQGVNTCNAEWEISILAAQRDSAVNDARALRAQVNATDVLNMELKYNAAEIQREVARLRDSLAGAHERCISDGVRDLARGIAGGAPSQGGPDGKSVVGRQAP